MELQEFKIFLEKYKAFRELPEQYRTDKFCKLYYKMYSYIISIPKEKIVLSHIIQRNNYIQYLFSYIYKFIEAKDFYNWKNRIYSLVTRKISNTNYKKFELFYNSKAKEFFNNVNNKIKVTVKSTWNSKTQKEKEQILEKRITTNLEIYGHNNPMQSNEIKEKVINKLVNKTKEEKEQIENKKKATNMKNRGVEYAAQSKEVQEKRKTTCLEIYRYENASQSKEVQDKISNTLKNKSKEEKEQIENKKKATNMKNRGVEYPAQDQSVQEKQKATNLEKYNILYPYQLANKHSKIADDMCLALDTLYGTLDSKDTRYFTKNREWWLKTEYGNYFLYDFTNIVEKWIVEFQGMYTHGLKEGQEYVWDTPVEEIHKRDEEKRILAEKNGYKVFYVYEDEYKSNKSKCLENLLKEIKNYVHSKENRI